MAKGSLACLLRRDILSKKLENIHDSYKNVFHKKTNVHSHIMHIKIYTEKFAGKTKPTCK
ncbi:hypothetical protein DWV84_10670 [Blautia sp. AF13-16]|nr:hypothetical protein C3R19_26120 [Blautia producta]RHS16415.1 hypothetical protein DWV84_10670 [Blautia sp. AF13-16]